MERNTFPTDTLTHFHHSVTELAMSTTLALLLVMTVQATTQYQLGWLGSHKNWELGDSEEG
jgi:hypothetical protein